MPNSKIGTKSLQICETINQVSKEAKRSFGGLFCPFFRSFFANQDVFPFAALVSQIVTKSLQICETINQVSKEAKRSFGGLFLPLFQIFFRKPICFPICGSCQPKIFKILPCVPTKSTIVY
jgi:hypothetical protein